MSKLANHIVVSTDYLATKFKRQNVHVCPNLISKSLFNPAPKTDKIKILWQGSSTHANDILIIDEVIDKCLSENHNCEFYMWGMHPSPHIYSKWIHKGLVVLEPCHIREYHEKLSRLSPHIVLAPLDKCEFNLSKSNLRILEAFAVGAIPLASSWGEYQNTLGPGYLVQDDKDFYEHVKSWIGTLSVLDSKESLAGDIRKDFAEEWYWNENDSWWTTVIDKILM
jgi:hypothetical protein